MIKCHGSHLTVAGVAGVVAGVAEAVGAVDTGVAEAVGAVAITAEVGVSFVPFLHAVWWKH